MNEDHLSGLQLRSLIADDGTLTLSLAEVEVGEAARDEVVVRVEATPINPSDLGLLLGPADLATLEAKGTPDRPVLTAAVPPGALAGGLLARVGQAMPVGNEGAGTVIRAGEEARDLLGRRVGMLGGAMYATLRRLPARDCIALPDEASAADGASMFVNPLTALAMLETMRAEGHHAIVHTAAASNLGLMLNRLCLADGVPLVCIVRSEAQATTLRAEGATQVVNSAAPDFRAALTDAVASTGATLAFDAIGGGDLANTILHAMEDAANRGAAYSRYGSATHKQVYLYGGLDTGPTLIDRGYGMAWGVGGFLLTSFLQRADPATVMRLRARIASELRTTFASRYTDAISLRDALDPVIVAAYARRATGRKYLIDPTL